MSVGVRRIGEVGAALVATFALGALPGTAAAASFSWGDVDPTDVITSVIVAPSDGDTTYTATTDQMAISGYISTINFANKGPISIPVGDVLFSSQLTLSNELLIGPAFDIAVVTGELSNGLADDFSIVDVGSATALMEGDFDGAMSFSASSVTGVVSANMAADIGSSLSGNSDFLLAFGNVGSLDLQVVLGAGTVCSTIATCPTAPNLTPPAVLHDFTGPTNITITPIPEPATGLLIGLGMLGLTLRARVRRIDSLDR